MGKFKVGDRVTRATRSELVFYKKLGTIIKVTKEGIKVRFDIKEYESFGEDILWTDDELRYEGEPMSKHEDLTRRINALDDGWNKEADDMLNEMNLGLFSIQIYTDRIDVYLCYDGTTVSKKGHTTFHYNSQCEKMSAFKQALLWLLDKSDIKNLVGQEVKADIEGKVYKVKVLSEV